jgi:hypothetical protein
MAVHAPDPYKPRVKIIKSPKNEFLEHPFELSLWEVPETVEGPKAVRAPLDPAEYSVDPLAFL